MILVNEDWSRIIDFEENRLNTILVENIEYFRSLVSSFIGQTDGMDGKFSLSHENKSIDLSKGVLVISDIFNLESGLKKTNSKISKYIKTLSFDSFEESKKIIFDIETYIDNLLDNVDLPIVRSESLAIEDVLKVGDIHVEQGDDIIDNLINVFNVCTALMGIRLFVFVNIHSLMSQSEWYRFIKTVLLKESNILVFESKLPDDYYIDKKLEKIYIIDEDLCEI